MAWIYTALTWYFSLFILGLIFVPLTKKIFGKFFLDFGYPFSKTLALLFLTYTAFVLGIFKILPFSQSNLIFVLFILAILNICLIFKTKGPIQRKTIFLVLFEEVFFLTSFIFWTFIRGQEPSIRGLEKFMDFGFINSILRSRYFPPLDIWLSADLAHPQGYPINYYYFGHLVGSLLIKLTGFNPAVGYNLILSTIFALATTQTFSLVINICLKYMSGVKKWVLNKSTFLKIIFFGILGSFIVNLGGNLHTIYVFSKGYSNDSPVPFWQILSEYNPSKYWYPNATRFIPFTIHEFPSYSYVVADLHGHVFDIPFVLLTLIIIFLLFIKASNHKLNNFRSMIINSVFLGFLTAVHYMTNAFDGPIYILLTLIVFAILLGFTRQLFLCAIILIASFLLFSAPLTLHFSPFIGGIGVNCSPEFLTNIGKLGPFLFIKDNCQISPLWMLFVLWGFFFINFILFLFVKYLTHHALNKQQEAINNFMFLLFSLGTFFLLIPEFFYIKDIYPAHFRANTMFKLGYQAFIMMGIASTITFFQIKNLDRLKSILPTLIFIFFFFFVAIYPSFSVPSYYGQLNRPVELNGSLWLSSVYHQDKEIADYLNDKIKGQPVILEAQGDSYTDFERISAFTGLPTIAGWWVHEWLWRGSPDIVGKRIPDVVTIYESHDINKTKELLKKYHVQYVIISKMERQKYSNLFEEKFLTLGRLIFKSSDGSGALYQLN